MGGGGCRGLATEACKWVGVMQGFGYRSVQVDSGADIGICHNIYQYFYP